MQNHLILTTIVGLLGVGLHLWLRRIATGDEPKRLGIERWAGERSSSANSSSSSAHSN